MLTALWPHRSHRVIPNYEVELPAMTTELSIEREANLRAQKKKILQLQRIKYSSATLTITDGNAASLGSDRYDFYAQQKLPNSSGNHIALAKVDTVGPEKAAERSTSNLESVDKNYGKVNKLGERSETPGLVLRNRNLVSPRRREGIFVEETTDNTDAKGTKISIIIDNAEPEKYTSTFVSASSEYHRKTTEIKKKADERRRNAISPSIRLSSALDMRSNNEDYLPVINLQAQRSTSLNDLNFQYDDFDSKRTKSHRSKNEFRDSSCPLVFGDRSLIPRSTSWSSFPTREKEVNFQGFARKQQEILEDNLRRVEQNLNTTFTRLRRYVNTETAIRSTEKSGQN